MFKRLKEMFKGWFGKSTTIEDGVKSPGIEVIDTADKSVNDDILKCIDLVISPGFAEAVIKSNPCETKAKYLHTDGKEYDMITDASMTPLVEEYKEEVEVAKQLTTAMDTIKTIESEKVEDVKSVNRKPKLRKTKPKASDSNAVSEKTVTEKPKAKAKAKRTVGDTNSIESKPKTTVKAKATKKPKGEDKK